MTDSQFAVVSAIGLIVLALLTGYTAARLEMTGKVECSVTVKDKFGDKHQWMTECDL